MHIYFIEETHYTADGNVNIETPVKKIGFSSALSFFGERVSKMAATNLYTRVAIKVVDSELNQVDDLYKVIIPNEER